MATLSTTQNTKSQKQMTINGHKVTLSFAPNYNPEISHLVRTALLDAYIRKHEIGSTTLQQ